MRWRDEFKYMNQERITKEQIMATKFEIYLQGRKITFCAATNRLQIFATPNQFRPAIGAIKRDFKTGDIIFCAYNQVDNCV